MRTINISEWEGYLKRLRRGGGEAGKIEIGKIRTDEAGSILLSLLLLPFRTLRGLPPFRGSHYFLESLYTPGR
jgi:hypothetical protein